jgi:hypothetical protein
VTDVATQRALRQLESVVNEIRGSTSAPIVTGSTDGNEALASLITALEQIGLIRNETTANSSAGLFHSSYAAAESERALWEGAATGATTTLSDGRPVRVGVSVRRHPSQLRYAVVIHVSVAFGERRPNFAGPHHNAYQLAPAFSGVADPAAYVLGVRDRVIEESRR